MACSSPSWVHPACRVKCPHVHTHRKTPPSTGPGLRNSMAPQNSQHAYSRLNTLVTLVLYPSLGTSCRAPVGTRRYVPRLHVVCITFPVGSEPVETPKRGSDHPLSLFPRPGVLWGLCQGFSNLCVHGNYPENIFLHRLLSPTHTISWRELG